MSTFGAVAQEHEIHINSQPFFIIYISSMSPGTTFFMALCTHIILKNDRLLSPVVVLLRADLSPRYILKATQNYEDIVLSWLKIHSSDDTNSYFL